MKDEFSCNVIRHIQTGGVWLTRQKEQEDQCIRYATQFVVQQGVLSRVKFKKGTKHLHNGAPLEPLVQWYIPDVDNLREELVAAIHKEMGHPGIMRTYQALHDRCFWVGMFAATMKQVSTCVTCQLHAPKAPAAPIQGHVSANAPAEVITMDLVHMPEANGMKYSLNVMDIFSKYGFSVPLAEATAASVTEALVNDVLLHGMGRPKYWIMDGGSEFKDVLTEAITAWGGIASDSSPNHPQSHGLIERYNRTLSNKTAKLLADEEDAVWTDVRAAAVEMTNCQVQESLTDNDAWLAPAEVWFARNPVLQSIPGRKMQTPTNMTTYVKRLAQHWKAVQQFVQESTRAYHQRMKKRDKNKNIQLRSFEIGDEVTYFSPNKSKRWAKVSPKQKGPYLVKEMHRNGTEYTIQRKGSRNKKDTRKVHVDHIRALKRFKETDAVERVAKPAAKRHAKCYDVEEVCGERESSGGQTQYLIKWKGYQGCNWEPMENLSCPEAVQEWTALSRTQQRSRYNAAVRVGIVSTVEQCKEDSACDGAEAAEEDFMRLLMDLSDEGIDDIFKHICGFTRIDEMQLAAVLASPPCETYSHADATNISRGYNFRDHSDPTKPARKLRKGASEQAVAKHNMAVRHDKMIQRLTLDLVELRRRCGCELVMENPVGSLAKRPFMIAADWLQAVKRFTVTYCAYGYKYMKPTHIWTSMWDGDTAWKPKGSTGDGLCKGRCGSGDKHQSEKRETFRHWEQIAGPASRQPLGLNGATRKQQLWSLPSMLTQEIMAHVAERQPGKKYVIDLFAGGESWRKSVEEQGYVYVPVAIRRLMTQKRQN
jgi:hypothetical protein